MDDVILFIAACLTVSLLFSEVCYRLRYPRIIGPILTGILMGFGPIRDFLTPSAREAISILSELAIVFLLLLAGMEINLTKLKRSSKDATLISFFSAIIPFILGFFLIKAFYQFGILTTFADQSTIVALVVGACLSLTAEGTSLAMLIEMNALKTRVGTLILASGILDDLFEIVFLSGLIVFVNDSSELIFLPLHIFAFVTLVILIWHAVPSIIQFIQKEDSRITTLSTIIVITFIIASISHLFGLGPVIGAFIAGIIIQVSNKDKDDERIDVEELKVLSFSLIVPFFFINIGLHFDFSSFFTHPFLIFSVVVIAFVSKILGTMVVTPFTDLTLRQTHLIGWAMNSRGAMELVILELARQNNLITSEVYSAIVIMAIITTLIFPAVFKQIVSRYPKILTERAEKPTDG